MTITPAQLKNLRASSGDRLQENVSLKRYTAARIGGLADVMVTVNSTEELTAVAKTCWENGLPFTILGSGSNVLVSDDGVRQVVILNQAKKITFNLSTELVTVLAESGANFGSLARLAATKGYSGLEWAAGIPGTVGGAVYGNAGAHGSDMAGCLVMANILHPKRSGKAQKPEVLQEEWPVEKFEYGYRSSNIKSQPGQVVVLSALIKLHQSTSDLVQAKMDEYTAMRRNSQPSGASLGSIFKNPPGDYAGRLVEAAGLKGKKMGKVEVSQKHANFFINQDSATASDYAALIHLVQKEVARKMGIKLELEIEFIGDWKDQ